MVDPAHGPTGGQRHHMGTRVEQQAEVLGEAQVVAGGQAGGAQWRVYYHDVFAGVDKRSFALIEAEQVALAVGGGHLAAVVEEHRGIEDAAVRCLLQERSRVQPDAVFSGDSGHGGGELAVEGLRGAEGFVEFEGPGGP